MLSEIPEGRGVVKLKSFAEFGGPLVEAFVGGSMPHVEAFVVSIEEEGMVEVVPLTSVFGAEAGPGASFVRGVVRSWRHELGERWGSKGGAS